MNPAKRRDPRQWAKWHRAGAVGECLPIPMAHAMAARQQVLHMAASWVGADPHRDFEIRQAAWLAHALTYWRLTGRWIDPAPHPNEQEIIPGMRRVQAFPFEHRYVEPAPLGQLRRRVAP